VECDHVRRERGKESVPEKQTGKDKKKFLKKCKIYL
jgi:hypothetical protein